MHRVSLNNLIHIERDNIKLIKLNFITKYNLHKIYINTQYKRGYKFDFLIEQVKMRLQMTSNEKFAI